MYWLNIAVMQQIIKCDNLFDIYKVGLAYIVRAQSGLLLSTTLWDDQLFSKKLSGSQLDTFFSMENNTLHKKYGLSSVATPVDFARIMKNSRQTTNDRNYFLSSMS